MLERDVEVLGDEVKVTTRFNTDAEEKENWDRAQHSDGFIRDRRGRLQGRLLADIPVQEAAMLEANRDIDWLSWRLNGDVSAFRRLLARFPHWRCSGGRF